MSSITDWLFELFSGVGVGARGLIVLVTAVIDSSLVSLPEVNDALLFYLTTISPGSAPLFVLAATAGSIIGCLLLNRLARWKGPALVVRFGGGRRARTAIRLYRRYGAWTLLVPALLPPPCPFKIFVLLSGALGLELRRFILAIAVGRSLRYGIGALLAIRYGERALALFESHAPLFVALVAAVFAIATALLARRVFTGWSMESERDEPESGSPFSPANELSQL